MFSRWRKNDGFDWVAYVPTQIVRRRKARRERVEQAAAKAKVAAKDAARKSAEGIGKGAAKAASAVKENGGALAHGAGVGLGRLGGRIGLLAQAGNQRLGRVARFAGLSVTRGAGVLGVLVLAGAGLRAALAAGRHDLDRPGRIAMACGLAALVVAVAPAIWRVVAPGLAGFALQALKTRQAGDRPRQPAPCGIQTGDCVRVLAGVGIPIAIRRISHRRAAPLRPPRGAWPTNDAKGPYSPALDDRHTTQTSPPPLFCLA